MPAFERPTLTIDPEPDGSLSLKIDVPGKPINVLSRQLLDDLDAALAWLESRDRVPVLVIRSGKKSGFLAGADLHEFAAIKVGTEATATSQRGQGVFNRLAALKAPTVAVVHGACLGGGLELALACDYRLAFDRTDTTFGLPEIELGLLPGWGGTMRLPRIVGLERALQMILAGKRLNAPEAKQWGLADAVASDEPTLREEVARLLVRATMAGKRDRTALPIRTWRQRFLEGNWLGRSVLLKGTERMVRQKTPDDMPAPLEALEAVRIGVNEGASAGLRREAEAAGRLAVTPACRNLIGLFFQREAARKPPAGDPRPIQKVAVVGAGVMGAGIAQLIALSGRDVVVKEMDETAAAAGAKRIDALFAKLVERKKATAAHAARRRGAIKVSWTYHGFADADLVIEAAVEDLALKTALFAELAAKTPAILATNTSSLTVTSLADVPQPGRVAGLHFFNPVHKMPLVEVVRHAGTADDVVARLKRFVLDLGKVPAAVGDGPGFVVNAVLMPYLEEAVILLSEGMKIADLDRLMRRFGMPVGPLEVLDQIGIGVAAHVSRHLGEKGVAASVFERMTAEGWSFYAGTRPNAAVEALAASQSAPSVALPAAVRLAEARERLVLRMVNEAARLAEAGRADADTIDLAMVLGTGWAPHRGGPLRYADTRGLADVARSLDALGGRLGPRFAAAEGLRRREQYRSPG